MGLTGSMEMLKTASKAGRYLGPDCGLVGKFLLACRNQDGGFRGRSAASDIYYTVFGLDAIAATGCLFDAAPTARYISSFGTGSSLDLVHLACLARCLARLAHDGVAEATRRAILTSAADFRSDDGGYNLTPGVAGTSAYACLLASMLHEDLGTEVPRLRSMGLALRGLRSGDGGFANEKGLKHGTVTATAAALTFMNRYGIGDKAGASQWLLARHCSDGGFLATPGAPFPDLLSTATALYALSSAGIPLDGIRSQSLDFVEMLMNDDGGFCGHGMDATPDCEYTFYGLLAIGSLAP